MTILIIASGLYALPRGGRFGGGRPSDLANDEIFGSSFDIANDFPRGGGGSSLLLIRKIFRSVVVVVGAWCIVIIIAPPPPPPLRRRIFVVDGLRW
jgi:hypothetical protein